MYPNGQASRIFLIKKSSICIIYWELLSYEIDSIDEALNEKLIQLIGTESNLLRVWKQINHIESIYQSKKVWKLHANYGYMSINNLFTTNTLTQND